MNLGQLFTFQSLYCQMLFESNNKINWFGIVIPIERTIKDLVGRIIFSEIILEIALNEHRRTNLK